MARKTLHAGETPATQWLRAHGVAFTEHRYDYVEHGGTSPFGFRREGVPVVFEASILDLPRICINGGRRGFLVGIEPRVLTDVLGARPVACAL